MAAQQRETLKRSLIGSRPYKVATTVLCLGILFAGSSTRAQAPPVVEWQERRLSVTADQVPLAQVLHEVAGRTGVEIRGLEALQEKVSVRLANLPLREGLQKLLTQVNYFLLEKPAPQGGTQPTLVLISGWQAPLLAETIANEEGTKPEGESMAEEDPEERLAALSTFAEQGNEEALRKAASDPDQAVSAMAFELLAQQNPVAATTLATAASRSPDLTQRLTGLQVLGQIDNALAEQTLGAASADDDVGVREYAIQSLASQTGSHATLLLSQALQDHDPSIRVLALEALASRGAEGQEALELALNTGDPLVRSRAAELLEQMKTDQEMPTAEDPQ
jgi:hypothetical protein